MNSKDIYPNVGLLTNWLFRKGAAMLERLLWEGPWGQGSLWAWFPAYRWGDSSAPSHGGRENTSTVSSWHIQGWGHGVSGVTAAGFSCLVWGGCLSSLKAHHRVGKGRSLTQFCSPSLLFPGFQIILISLGITTSLSPGLHCSPVDFPGPCSCLLDMECQHLPAPLATRPLWSGGWLRKRQLGPLHGPPPCTMQTRDKSSASEAEVSPFLVPTCPS